MLTELCQELKNWFDRFRYNGSFTITEEDITFADGTEIGLKQGQYFRIIGSIFSDGVHQYPAFDLPAETFDGAVWALAIPKEVVALADEISAWRATYEATDSQAMSPYMSESFGGYSYTKGSVNGAGSSNGSTSSWRSVFKIRLNMWRKILP